MKRSQSDKMVIWRPGGGRESGAGTTREHLQDLVKQPTEQHPRIHLFLVDNITSILVGFTLMVIE